MTYVLELYNSLKDQYNQEKEHPEKFIHTLKFANKENIDLLKEKQIKLKPSNWIVLAMEPELLKKHVLRAEELGFIDAYHQNPSYMKTNVDDIIKRISELEHLGIPYKNDKGKYQSFLFSQRGYNYIVTQNQNKEKKNPHSEKLLRYASRIIEAYALDELKEEIYQKLSEVEKKNLSFKDSLMETFSDYCDNRDFLESTINELLANDVEQNTRRVA